MSVVSILNLNNTDYCMSGFADHKSGFIFFSGLYGLAYKISVPPNRPFALVAQVSIGSFGGYQATSDSDLRLGYFSDCLHVTAINLDTMAVVDRGIIQPSMASCRMCLDLGRHILSFFFIYDPPSSSTILTFNATDLSGPLQTFPFQSPQIPSNSDSFFVSSFWGTHFLFFTSRPTVLAPSVRNSVVQSVFLGVFNVSQPHAVSCPVPAWHSIQISSVTGNIYTTCNIAGNYVSSNFVEISSQDFTIMRILPVNFAHSFAFYGSEANLAILQDRTNDSSHLMFVCTNQTDFSPMQMCGEIFDFPYGMIQTGFEFKNQTSGKTFFYLAAQNFVVKFDPVTQSITGILQIPKFYLQNVFCMDSFLDPVLGIGYFASNEGAVFSVNLVSKDMEILAWNGVSEYLPSSDDFGFAKMINPDPVFGFSTIYVLDDSNLFALNSTLDIVAESYYSLATNSFIFDFKAEYGYATSGFDTQSTISKILIKDNKILQDSMYLSQNLVSGFVFNPSATSFGNFLLHSSSGGAAGILFFKGTELSKGQIAYIASKTFENSFSASAVFAQNSYYPSTFYIAVAQQITSQTTVYSVNPMSLSLTASAPLNSPIFAQIPSTVGGIDTYTNSLYFLFENSYFSNFLIGCPTGSMSQANKCIFCPPDTFMDNSGTCQMCSVARVSYEGYCPAGTAYAPLPMPIPGISLPPFQKMISPDLNLADHKVFQSTSFLDLEIYLAVSCSFTLFVVLFLLFISRCNSKNRKVEIENENSEMDTAINMNDQGGEKSKLIQTNPKRSRFCCCCCFHYISSAFRYMKSALGNMYSCVLQGFPTLLRKSDIFSKDHATPLDSPFIRRKTVFGGVITIACFCAACAVAFINLWNYVNANTTTTITILPEITTQSISGNFGIVANFVGMNVAACHGFVLSTSANLNGVASVENSQDGFGCQVRFSCLDPSECKVSPGQGQEVTFAFTDVRAYAAYINFTLSLPPLSPSSGSDLESISSTLVPTNKGVFRGATPSMVSIALTRVSQTASTGEEHQQLMVSQATTLPGSSTTDIDLFSEQGVSITFTISLQSSYISSDTRKTLSLSQYLSICVAQIGLVLAAARFVIPFVESLCSKA